MLITRPPKFRKIETAAESELSWDAIANDDDVELWLIKCPHDVTLPQLEAAPFKPSAKVLAQGLVGSHASRKYELVDAEELFGIETALPKQSSLQLGASTDERD